jgi:hypothetical protein
MVITKISAFLSKAWTVKRISYPKGAFSSLDERQHPLFYNYDDDLKGIVRRVTSSTKCDHYVVVVKSSSRYGETNQSVYGLGIVESGASFLTFDLIYALYWIRIYDGQTYEVIGKRGAITEQSNPLLSLVTTKSIGWPLSQGRSLVVARVGCGKEHDAERRYPISCGEKPRRDDAFDPARGVGMASLAGAACVPHGVPSNEDISARRRFPATRRHRASASNRARVTARRDCGISARACPGARPSRFEVPACRGALPALSRSPGRARR